MYSKKLTNSSLHGRLCNEMKFFFKGEMNMAKALTGYASIDKPQNIGFSVFKQHPIIPDINVYNALVMLSIFYRGKIAIDCKEIVATYQKMIDDAKTVSLALKELGVRKGEIVTVSMPNFYQAVLMFLACNRIGAVTTFLNYFASDEEIKYYLNLFESSVYVNYGRTKEDNYAMKKDTKVRTVITLGKSCNNKLEIFENYKDSYDGLTVDFNSLGSIATYQKRKFELPHSSKENALILFTSGSSTGKSKAVVLTNENVLAAGTYLKNSSKIKNNKDERTLVCVPFAYPYGFGTSTLMTLLSNKTAILGPDIGANTILYYMRKKPEMIFGSPALMELIKRNVPSGEDLSFLHTFISGGDFFGIKAYEDSKRFFREHNAPDIEIGNGSGNAETMSCGTNPVGIKPKPGTAGRVLVGTECMIMDLDTMEEKRYGEEGTLCVSGRHVFKEYYGNPEMTNEVKFEYKGRVYFKTGTIGYLDEEGYFTPTKRESRFYITATLDKVYPDPIQNFICGFEPVMDCAVVATPDEEMLFVNTAYVVLEDKYKTVDLDSIKDYILELCHKESPSGKKLRSIEVPTYIEIVDELPRRQGTDKIDYLTLEKRSEDMVEKAKRIYLQ